MGEKADTNKDDTFEVLDLTEITNGTFFNKAMKDLTKASVAKQLAIGGASGWLTGYVFGKVGKAAAGAIGGSLLILQIASHKGLITINWGKLEKSVNSAKKKFRKETDKSLPYIIDSLKDFAAENVFLAGGFGAGVLLGLAS